MRRPCAWRASPLQDADRGPGAAELIALVTDAARAAGEVALKTFRGQCKQWLKDKTSPVCEADIAVDELLRERLLGNGVSCGWLSEETEALPSRLEAKRIWIVDPIDGTRA